MDFMEEKVAMDEGKGRSTWNQANPWIKSNKTSSNQQITKKNWGYFWWGIFEITEEDTTINLENKEGGSQIVFNVAHDTKMM